MWTVKMAGDPEQDRDDERRKNPTDLPVREAGLLISCSGNKVA